MLGIIATVLLICVGASIDVNQFLLKNASKNIEPEVPNCYLKPIKAFDYPTFCEENNAVYMYLEKNFEENLVDEFFEKFPSISHTKLGGYPSFIQDPYSPICKCGRIKEFLFQLSSDDREYGATYSHTKIYWSDHGIMIGDAGNIYYYICTHCGEKSIESYWDCS